MSGRSNGQSSVTVGTTSAPTTSSGTPATIPEMTKTITTRGGNLLAIFQGQFFHSALAGSATLGFTLDGGAQVATSSWQDPVSNDSAILVIKHLFVNVAPGSHTVLVQWATSGAMLTAATTLRELTLIEMPS